MSITEKLERSNEIVRLAIEAHKPAAIVSLVSGGNDSMTAFYVGQRLGIRLNKILHVFTGTGIQETRSFVEQWSQYVDTPITVSGAGPKYARYVFRKGFFGRGQTAHKFAYHILKADQIRSGLVSIRHELHLRPSAPILMLTGIRLDESLNRKYNFANQTVKQDRDDPAWFVNLIEHWTAEDCRELLAEVKAPRNPVSKALHRSAECMCGTMQSLEDRQLAGSLYPQWGKWLNKLESDVRRRGHDWGWGQDVPKSFAQEKAGQLPMFEPEGFELCRHCIAQAEIA